MKILSMTATFGKLSHKTLTLQPGLNVLQAPNEWGKSTWCAFIVAMLYGIDTRERSKAGMLADKERYAPWSGEPMSGRMELQWQGRNITIERRSKGRTVFGEFSAYETDTGLPIPELTAANCGQQLLGVEKEVFTRAGFIRMTDLPVTQDENLRRRLNALVTTGDESGTSDALAQKLRDLKNRCRHNKTGLLPQAEAQRRELEDKLTQLQNLQEQTQRISQQQAALEQQIVKLENHRDALAYEANRTYVQKLATAEAADEAAKLRLDTLTQQCAALPTAEEAAHTVAQLHQLQQQWEALQIEIHMLPSAPQQPESSRYFQGLTPQEAVDKANADMDSYNALTSAQRKRGAAIAAGLLALVGIGLLLIPSWICRGIGIALIAAGCVLFYVNHSAARRAAGQANALSSSYAPLPVAQWVSAAKAYAEAQDAYRAAAAQHQQSRTALDQRLTDLRQTLNAVTNGASLAECEQSWNSILADRKALEDAQREHFRAQELVQALRSSHKDAPAPKFPDTLTYTEAETARLLSDAAVQRKQLTLRQGQTAGLMETLGQPQNLQQQLDAVRARIARLEDTYAALSIAQQTLAGASSALQRRFAPRIARRAQELFGKLTGSRYDRLTLGEDLAVSTGAIGEDTLHTALWRSDGTVDQLYLSLRLAVAQALTPDAPLVLDDALVRFDDTRLAAAMEVLREEAEEKQVILFTCQSREAAL